MYKYIAEGTCNIYVKKSNKVRLLGPIRPFENEITETRKVLGDQLLMESFVRFEGGFNLQTLKRLP